MVGFRRSHVRFADTVGRRSAVLFGAMPLKDMSSVAGPGFVHKL